MVSSTGEHGAVGATRISSRHTQHVHVNSAMSMSNERTSSCCCIGHKRAALSKTFTTNDMVPESLEVTTSPSGRKVTMYPSAALPHLSCSCKYMRNTAWA